MKLEPLIRASEAMLAPLNCHWPVKGRPPEAMAVKVAVMTPINEIFEGWERIVGGFRIDKETERLWTVPSIRFVNQMVAL